jgi:hypothetical protein
MANPLTLYVPIKQTKEIQELAQSSYDGFAVRHRKDLDKFKDVHYARFVLIPNHGKPGIFAICVITTFDGPMNPYLRFFWDDMRDMFKGVTEMALDPPPPLNDFTAFANFINANNLSKPVDLYHAYDQSVREIWAKFPPPV